MNVTGDGLVDWEEFCSYMLTQYLEKDSLKQKMLPFQDPPKVRSMFCKVSPPQPPPPPVHHYSQGLHYGYIYSSIYHIMARCQRSELVLLRYVCSCSALGCWPHSMVWDWYMLFSLGTFPSVPLCMYKYLMMKTSTTDSG